MANPTWLTTKEGSKKAGVSDAYLRRLCENGRLNAQLRGNSWLIDPESFRQWQAGRRVRKTTT